MTPRRNQVTYSNRPNHAARVAHAKGDRQFRTYDTSHIRPKRSKAPAIIGGVIAVVVVVAVVVAVMFGMRSCSQVELVPEGEQGGGYGRAGSGAAQIASDLVEAKLIARCERICGPRERALEAASSLQPGTYTIAGGTSIDDIIATLTAGAGH